MASIIDRGLRKLRRMAIRRSAAFRSPLNVAVVGFGEIAPDHVAAYEGSGIARVVAVSDVRPPALARALDRWPGLRAYRDYRRMLAEMRPDVVSICTWPQSHAEMVEAAAAAGVRGIVCEKPLALRLDELDRMRAACEPRGVKLAGGHQYRFHRHFIRVAGLVRSGALGAIRSVRAEVKGSLANNGPHLVDTVRFLLGDPAALRVECRCERERCEFNRGIPAEDGARATMQFAGGLRVALETGDFATEFFRIVVEGDRGKAAVSPKWLEVDGEGRVEGEPDCRAAQFKEFLRWVKGQRPGYVADFEQGARSAELVLALYESARLGSPVELPLRNRGDVIAGLYPEATAEPASEPVADGPATTAGARIPADDRLAMDGGRRAVTRWYSTGPVLGASELANLGRVVASRNLNCVDGRMVPALEREFARSYGSPHAVASTSGTAAIHVALGALGLDPGDEVITTPMTDMGTVIPILACNCIPIFADVDPITGNLTAESIAAKISPRTRAVILVHLFGRPAELGPIGELLQGRGIHLVEDCSQAHAAEYRGRKVGTYGDFGCFSLQQSKQITCGDGGITLVNREDLARRAALFVDKGWDRSRGVRAHLFLGMNYRMTELQGAVALGQLRRLPGLIDARRRAAADLTRRLREVPGLIPAPEQSGIDPSWWMYPFAIDEDRVGVTSDEFAEALLVEGVRVRRQYLPEPIFEYDVLKYQRTYGNSRFPFSSFPYEPPGAADFPGLQEFGRRLLFLQWSHHVRPGHVAAIAAGVRKVATRLPTASHVEPIRGTIASGDRARAMVLGHHPA
jgi:dTDP-4-amino-4,6-dideoxygalactose transaminase/predicted dehydrogenase